MLTLGLTLAHRSDAVPVTPRCTVRTGIPLCSLFAMTQTNTINYSR